MTTIFHFIFAIVLATSYASVMRHPVSKRLRSGMPAAVTARIETVQGCNANLCFALDGSSDLTEEEFENEKFFVMDTVAVIGVDEPAEYAAVQYSIGNSPISPITNDSFPFLLNVDDTVHQNRSRSAMNAGILYCINELRGRPGEANKIIMLGDGRTTIGRSPIRAANQFRKVGGDVCVVGAGFKQDDSELLAIAGNDPSRVFQVDSFFDTFSLEKIVEKLVVQACGH